MTDAIAEFWDERASLEEQAGTQDLIAKELEINAIAKYVKDGMRVLDAGCGNGMTAVELALRYDIEIVGCDTSQKMIDAAGERAFAKRYDGVEVLGLGASKRMVGMSAVRFRCADIMDLPDDLGMFDLIYTERTLINLPDQKARERAVVGLCKLLKPRGLYVMCENSQDGLDGINRLRVKLDLPEIVPPWHNHYLTDEDIDGFCRAAQDVAFLKGEDNYSSIYYFLSRIVNAAMAAEEGREPEYDSFVNRLALKLPAIVNGFGQGRIWLWRRI